MVLTDLVSRGLDVVNRRYPVPGESSFMHLQTCSVEDEQMTTAMHLLGNKMAVRSQAVMENICGESNPERNKNWDVFFDTQSLYRVAQMPEVEGGYAVMVKHFGDTKWEYLNPPVLQLF